MPVTRSLARNDRKQDVEDAVPYGVQQSYGDVGTPSPTTAQRTRPQEAMPTAPRRQHKEAGASACQLVEKVRMAFFGKLAGKIAK